MVYTWHRCVTEIDDIRNGSDWHFDARISKMNIFKINQNKFI